MVRTIERVELKRRLEEESDLVLIEVLAEREYRRKHIKGAINIPFKQIAHVARDRFVRDNPSCYWRQLQEANARTESSQHPDPRVRLPVLS